MVSDEQLEDTDRFRDNGDGGCCHAERATVFNMETINVTTPSPLSLLSKPAGVRSNSF